MPNLKPKTHSTQAIREVNAKHVEVHNKQRGSASARGYDAKWRKAREQYLRRNQCCVHCDLYFGRIEEAAAVDHIIEHNGQGDPLFWDETNYQALCESCHNRKTGRSHARRQSNG